VSGEQVGLQRGAGDSAGVAPDMAAEPSRRRTPARYTGPTASEQARRRLWPMRAERSCRKEPLLNGESRAGWRDWLAEALVTVTLIAREPGAPEPRELRQALFGWAFNPFSRDQAPREKVAAALDWTQRASLPVAALQDTATVRLALTACARNLDGKPAAGSTQRRKRSVFYNALSSRPGRTASATSRPTTCARARVAYVWWQRPQLSRTVAGHKNLLGKLGSDPVP